MLHNTRPDVKSFLDARLYLQEIYNYNKSQQSKFSYDSWAKELGIVSRSYLRLAIIGKRKISEILMQKLSDWLQLEENDREYFYILTQYTQSKVQQHKHVLGKKLTSMLKTGTEFSEINPEMDLLDSPLVLVVRNILSFIDIPRSVEYISKLVNLSPHVVEQILVKLSKHNLVQKSENQWQATHDNIKISSNINNESIRFYHKMSLQRALQAQELPATERFYKSINLALSEENYQSFINDLDAFTKEIFAKYNSDELIGKRVYQTNFNAIPWTKKAEESV